MKLKLYFDKYLLKINLIFITLLITFGLFLVSSATAVESQRLYGDNFYMIKNHLLTLSIGIASALVIKRVNYKRILNSSNYLIIFISITLFILLTYGDNFWGSTRWLPVGFVSIQPSEVAKPIILIWVANHLSKVELDNNNSGTSINGFIKLHITQTVLVFNNLSRPVESNEQFLNMEIN